MHSVKCALLLGVVLFFGGPSRTLGAEGSAVEATHASSWTEVVPAPVPAEGIPLLGPAGRDQAGFPRQDVDRAAVHGLLVRKEFKRLTRLVENVQARFEADPRLERWVVGVGASLGAPHPNELNLIEQWIAASPRSFAPYLARGIYWERTAFLWRGGHTAKETSEREFEAMSQAIERARADLERARSLRPGLTLALDELISVHLLRGERESARRAVDSALARCPSCYRPRFLWVEALRPRWGGSFEEMEQFVRERSAPSDPRRPFLEALVDWDRGEEAVFLGKKEEAEAFHDQACAEGRGDSTFAVLCAGRRGKDADPGGALADLDRAAEAHAGDHLVLLARARTLARMKRWEDAGRDLLYVLRTDPTVTTRLHGQVVNALATLAAKANQGGRPDDEQRLHALARDLAPGAEVLARKPEPRPPELATDASRSDGPEDGRPTLTVVVRDDAGHAAAGATVAVLFRLGSAADVARALERPRETLETDAAGVVRLPARVGPALVVARLPGPALRGGVVGVDVPPAGGRATVAPAGEATIAGRLLDPGGRPLAGVEVWAIPVLEKADGRARSVAAARSSDDGAFAIGGVDGGAYRLFIHSDVHAGPKAGVAAEGNGPPVVVPGERYQVLRGRVMVTGPGGLRPAPEVVLTGLGYGPRSTPTAEGRFSFRFSERSRSSAVSFSVPGRPALFRTLDVSGDETDVGDVVIGAGRTLKGRVVDRAGDPIWEAAIRASTGQELAKTVADGTFEVEVQDGPVELSVWRQGYLGVTRQIGAAETDVAVTLSRGAQLRVLLLDEDDKPVSDVDLLAVGAASCKTDPGGRCELRGLPPGEAVVGPAMFVRARGVLPAPPRLHVPGLGADEERTLVIRWPRTPTGLAVRAAKPSGPWKLPPAEVYPASPRVLQASSAANLTTEPHYVVDSTGRLQNLPAGRYLVVQRGGDGSCDMAVVELGRGAEQTAALEPRVGGCERPGRR